MFMAVMRLGVFRLEMVKKEKNVCRQWSPVDWARLYDDDEHRTARLYNIHYLSYFFFLLNFIFKGLFNILK
jgi:hypothetical protein